MKEYRSLEHKNTIRFIAIGHEKTRSFLKNQIQAVYDYEDQMGLEAVG